MNTPRVIVAERPGIERPATQREVCVHWMVPVEAYSGGMQHRRCGFGCGHSDRVPVKGKAVER